MLISLSVVMALVSGVGPGDGNPIATPKLKARVMIWKNSQSEDSSRPVCYEDVNIQASVANPKHSGPPVYLSSCKTTLEEIKGVSEEVTLSPILNIVYYERDGRTYRDYNMALMIFSENRREVRTPILIRSQTGGGSDYISLTGYSNPFGPGNGFTITIHIDSPEKFDDYDDKSQLGPGPVE
jgi:hypothetical protein